MRFLIFLFIVMPALEIGIFIAAGKAIGGLSTIILIIATGVLGAYLAKQQGLGVLNKVREQMSRGIPPGEALMEGLCVLVGGLLLLTPGFVTDMTGLFLILPWTRNMLKPFLIKWMRNRINRKQFYIYR